MREKFKIGENVRLDKDIRNGSLVVVVSQTPKRLFTRVKSNGTEWDVMTYRLSKIIFNEGNL